MLSMRIRYLPTCIRTGCDSWIVTTRNNARKIFTTTSSVCHQNSRKGKDDGRVSPSVIPLVYFFFFYSIIAVLACGISLHVRVQQVFFFFVSYYQYFSVILLTFAHILYIHTYIHTCLLAWFALLCWIFIIIIYYLLFYYIEYMFL